MDMNNNQNNGYNQPVQEPTYQNQFVERTPHYNQGRVQPVSGWNWGAFMYNWIWGIANGCYLPLLVFVPFFNLIWMFVCGAKGNEWAMNSGMWNTVEEFNAVQKSWNRAGKFAFWFVVITYAAVIVMWILMLVLSVGIAGLGAGLSGLEY